MPVVSYLGPATAFVVTGLAGRRDGVRPAGHGALSRAGRDQSRLHARDGDDRRVRRHHAPVQSRRRPALQLAGSSRAA